MPTRPLPASIRLAVIALGPIALGLVVLASPAGAAPATPQAPNFLLRGKFSVPRAQPGGDALRGSLDAASANPASLSAPATPQGLTLKGATVQTAAAAPSAPVAATALPGLPGAGKPFGGGLASGLAAPSALPALPLWPAVGDAAPICRASCARTRMFCAAGDREDCAPRWVQCVATCGGAPQG